MKNLPKLCMLRFMEPISNAVLISQLFSWCLCKNLERRDDIQFLISLVNAQ